MQQCIMQRVSITRPQRLIKNINENEGMAICKLMTQAKSSIKAYGVTYKAFKLDFSLGIKTEKI